MRKRSIDISFTGSRTGLSVRQGTALSLIIESLFCTYSTIRAHHGDCKGSDKDFNDIIAKMADKYRRKQNNVEIHLYPCDLSDQRAFCNKRKYLGLKTFEYEVKPPLVRNKDIVDKSKFLIACPDRSETLRSGTWSTVRYARSKNKSILNLEF